jgi:hypothetical protein
MQINISNRRIHTKDAAKAKKKINIPTARLKEDVK